MQQPPRATRAGSCVCVGGALTRGPSLCSCCQEQLGSITMHVAGSFRQQQLGRDYICVLPSRGARGGHSPGEPQSFLVNQGPVCSGVRSQQETRQRRRAGLVGVGPSGGGRGRRTQGVAANGE